MPATVKIQQVKEDLGEDIAKLLQEQYPGMYIYVSNNPAALDFESPDARNQYILNLANSGRTYDYIADKVGLSKDRITKIIADTYKSKKSES